MKERAEALLKTGSLYPHSLIRSDTYIQLIQTQGLIEVDSLNQNR
ncbi:hypothetical protein [Scytonema sp. PCC 10023]